MAANSRACPTGSAQPHTATLTCGQRSQRPQRQSCSESPSCLQCRAFIHPAGCKHPHGQLRHSSPFPPQQHPSDDDSHLPPCCSHLWGRAQLCVTLTKPCDEGLNQPALSCSHCPGRVNTNTTQRFRTGSAGKTQSLVGRAGGQQRKRRVIACLHTWNRCHVGSEVTRHCSHAQVTGGMACRLVWL